MIRKIKLCKYCRKEINTKDGVFCSKWCKQQKQLEITKIKKKKFKIIKVAKIKLPRKCKCGNDLKWHRQLCDDCLSKPYEYTICDNPCKNCGGKINARLSKKYVKLFCEPKCAKAYYYKNKENNLIL